VTAQSVQWLDNGMDDREVGVRFPAGERVLFPFSTIFRPTLRLVSPRTKRQGVKLTTHFHQMAGLRMAELCLHSLMCFNGVVLIKSEIAD
jgi:hypothetical protein